MTSSRVFAVAPTFRSTLTRALLFGRPFAHQPWPKTLYAAEPADFMYLDPPYWGSPSTIYDYAEINHEQLRDELAVLPCKWLLSYNDVPQVRELYAGYDMVAPTSHSYSWRATDDIANGRQANELLIANYKMPTQLTMWPECGPNG